MTWICQLESWPHFDYDETVIRELEQQFLQKVGHQSGVAAHFNSQDTVTVMVDILSNEALKTSAIEGEYFNRDSLRSSIQQHLGLGKDRQKVRPGEEGIAEMMTVLYRHYAEPLSHTILYEWHNMITRGRWDLDFVARYRAHDEPMQIISGGLHLPKVHYEAPPSEVVYDEMDRFIQWYQASQPGGKKQWSILVRAAVAHLYFLCVHPFEDGNGRIARALTIKALSESIQQPILLTLSHVIEKNKKKYYSALASTNHSNDMTGWLIYFSETILEAQDYTKELMDFIILKAKIFSRHRKELNPRQEKAIARIFKEGLEGFEGGLSANNYLSITKTSASTATRDLQALVEMGILRRTGEKKATRYYLVIDA